MRDRHGHLRREPGGRWGKATGRPIGKRNGESRGSCYDSGVVNRPILRPIVERAQVGAVSGTRAGTLPHVTDEHASGRESPAIESVLGPLGGAIARIVFERGEATVGDVVEALAAKGRRPAYTTVMTVMSRLSERGVLRRSKTGRQYVYRPAAEEAALLDAMSERAVDDLIGRYGSAALRQFALRLKEVDPDLRAQLIELASRR